MVGSNNGSGRENIIGDSSPPIYPGLHPVSGGGRANGDGTNIEERKKEFFIPAYAHTEGGGYFVEVPDTANRPNNYSDLVQDIGVLAAVEPPPNFSVDALVAELTRLQPESGKNPAPKEVYRALEVFLSQISRLRPDIHEQVLVQVNAFYSPNVPPKRDPENDLTGYTPVSDKRLGRIPVIFPMSENCS